MMRTIPSGIGFSRRGPHVTARRSHVGALARALRSLCAAAAVVLALSVPASAQQSDGKQKDESGVRWDDGSIRFGDSVRIDPKVRLQGDVLLWTDVGPVGDRFSWGSRRIGVAGELFNRVQFQVERAFQDDDDDDTPWRDVYVDVRINRAFQVRGGRFKLPYSLERNTSRDTLDFIQRATAVRAISPARDTGVMVHGRIANRVVEYEAGVFQHADGFDLTDDPNSWNALGATLAGRVAVDPIRDKDDGPTRNLHFGAALVRNTMPEGLNSVVGRLFDNDRFSERMNVNGQRTRLGAEAVWEGRRVTVKGELLQLSDQRLGQAITGEDLSDLVMRGGYVTGVVRVFGERGRRGQALDVAARIDRLTLGSANDTDEPFTNPRADNIAPLAKNTWTFGGNWQVHRWVRVQGNLIREVLVDSLGVREIDTEPRWTAVMRFQFAL
jgi:phosphate-selective porin